MLKKKHQEPFNWQKALESRPVTASAPCRVDMGGTLDIRTFSYPLQHLAPCTLSIALEMRTTVSLTPYARGRIRITSRGFKGADYAAGQAPYDHPMGLMFAVADFFRASGVQIAIHSESPPRSALGGSSVAAVALAAALSEARRRRSPQAVISARSIGLLAHAVEESVAGVPCGYQDQLAAVYGGVNAWLWIALPRTSVFQRQSVVPRRRYAELEERLLVAYLRDPPRIPRHQRPLGAAVRLRPHPAALGGHRALDAPVRGRLEVQRLRRGRRQHEPGDGRAMPFDPGRAGRHRPQAGRGRPPRRVRSAFHRRRRWGLPLGPR